MGNTSSASYTDITNEINTTVENATTNIQTNLNESVHDATTNLVAEVASEIQQSTSGANIISTGGDIVARKNAKINLTQMVSVDTINDAAIKISNDQSTMAKLASNISASMSDKIANNNELKANLQAINDIKKTNSEAGGPEGMVSKVADAIGSVLGSSKSTSDTTIIRNAIKMAVKNTTINNTTIKNIIKDSVTTNIKNINKSTCKMTSSGSNEIAVGGSIIAEEGAEVTISQSAVVKALNKCMIEQLATTKLINDISSVNVSQTSTDTSNTTKADNAMKADNKVVILNEQRDFLTELMAMLPTIIIVLGIVAVIGGGLFFAYLIFTKKDLDLDEDDDCLEEEKDEDGNCPIKKDDDCLEEEKDEEGNCPIKKDTKCLEDDKDEEGNCPIKKDTKCLEDDKDEEGNCPIKKSNTKGKKMKGGNIMNPQLQIYALALSGLFYMLSKYKKQTINK